MCIDSHIPANDEGQSTGDHEMKNEWKEEKGIDSESCVAAGACCLSPSGSQDVDDGYIRTVGGTALL